MNHLWIVHHYCFSLSVQLSIISKLSHTPNTSVLFSYSTWLFLNCVVYDCSFSQYAYDAYLMSSQSRLKTRPSYSLWWGTWASYYAVDLVYDLLVDSMIVTCSISSVGGWSIHLLLPVFIFLNGKCLVQTRLVGV